MARVRKKAKTLEEFQFDELRKYIRSTSKTPERDELMVLLSFRAGLRAAEIAKIDMDQLTDVQGRPAKMITILHTVGKMGGSREIPMHPHISDALIRFRRRYPELTYVAFSPINSARMTPNALTVWFWRLMQSVGFKGASSHSGRRTFCTNLGRRVNKFSNSLADVQRLMGHARLDTTQGYLEHREDTFSMVSSLGMEM
jgi:integrase/recombinase XerD